MDVLLGSRDPALLQRLALALEARGGQVVTAEKSGALLIEALDHDFGLFVVDACLEGMDGLETLGILRQMRPRVPVLFLHASEDEAAAVRLEAGRVETLVRTAEEGAVLQAIERLTAKASGEGLFTPLC